MTRIPRPSRTNCTAIVVTYNPDEGLSERLALHLRAFDRLTLVDNGSLPEALRQIESFQDRHGDRIKVIKNDINLGVAAAFNLGASAALADGCEWLALFDQDSRIDGGLIEAVALAIESVPANSFGLIGANYLSLPQGTDGYGISPSAPLAVPRTTVITSGTFVPVATWRRLQGLYGPLFIDHVDDEFCLRARLLGLQVYCTRAPLFSHTIGKAERRRLLWRWVYPMNQTPTRWYYVTRNFIALAWVVRKTELRWALRAGYEILKRAAKMLAYEDSRLAKVQAICRGLADSAKMIQLLNDGRR